jgi:hypothetical protein
VNPEVYVQDLASQCDIQYEESVMIVILSLMTVIFVMHIRCLQSLFNYDDRMVCSGAKSDWYFVTYSVRCVTHCFLVTSNDYVTFEKKVIRYCNRTVTHIIR